MTAADLVKWISPVAAVTVFTVMLSLGLLLEREQIISALRRRTMLAAVLFAVVVPLPALAVIVVKLFGLRGAVAAGIILMAISPGAPIALRRAIEAGGGPQFVPTLHLAIVMFAVITVPLSVMVMAWIFSVRFANCPLDVARQVFFAQLLPLGIGAALRAWRGGNEGTEGRCSRGQANEQWQSCASTTYGSDLYDGQYTWNEGTYRCVSL